MMAPPRGEVLQGTLDLIVLKTPKRLGRCTGYGIAQRIQQVSEDLLQLNQARSIRHCCAWNSGDGSPPNGVLRKQPQSQYYRDADGPKTMLAETEAGNE